MSHSEYASEVISGDFVDQDGAGLSSVHHGGAPRTTVGMTDGTVVVHANQEETGGSSVDNGLDKGTPAVSTLRKGCRVTKQRGPEYQYFEFTPANKVKCKLCRISEMLPHVGRMRYHLLFKCCGKVPSEIRELCRDYKVNHHKAEMTKKNRNKRRKKNSVSEDEEEEDDDEATTAVRSIGGGRSVEATPRGSSPRAALRRGALTEDKKRAVELLQELMHISDGNTGRRKPLSQYTDEDFKKEERELNLKKLRLEVQVLENKAGVITRLEEFLEKASSALDVYMEDRTRQVEVASNRVHVVYADNADSQTNSQNHTEPGPQW